MTIDEINKDIQQHALNIGYYCSDITEDLDEKVVEYICRIMDELGALMIGCAKLNEHIRSIDSKHG